MLDAVDVGKRAGDQDLAHDTFVPLREARRTRETEKPFRAGGRARVFGACLARMDARQPLRPDLWRSGRRIRVAWANASVSWSAHDDPGVKSLAESQFLHSEHLSGIIDLIGKVSQLFWIILVPARTSTTSASFSPQPDLRARRRCLRACRSTTGPGPRRRSARPPRRRNAVGGEMPALIAGGVRTAAYPQARDIEIGAAGARCARRRSGLVGRNDWISACPARSCASVPWRFSNAQPSTSMSNRSSAAGSDARSTTWSMPMMVKGVAIVVLPIRSRWEMNLARVTSVLTCRNSPPRGREYNMVSPSRTNPTFSCTRNDAEFSANVPQ